MVTGLFGLKKSKNKKTSTRTFFRHILDTSKKPLEVFWTLFRQTQKTSKGFVYCIVENFTFLISSLTEILVDSTSSEDVANHCLCILPSARQ